MPRIDFYILPEHNIPLRFVCNLTSKAKAEGLSVHIWAQDKEQALKLDDNLWTFRDISFIPHTLADDANAAEYTVTIGWTGLQQTHSEVLINLGHNEAENCAGYNRILELVSGEDKAKQRARELYRKYRDQGYELHTHNIEHANG